MDYMCFWDDQTIFFMLKNGWFQFFVNNFVNAISTSLIEVQIIFPLFLNSIGVSFVKHKGHIDII